MTVRAVEGKKPYTGGKAIEIDENKVINLRLRSENNLIIYDEGDNEIYVDLQLPDELTPTDAFPVGITTGRVIVDNGWDWQGTIVCFKTTSGDNIKLLYADDGKLYIDNGTGTFKQIYLKGEVDALLLALRQYVDQQLALKQDKLIAGDRITINADGKTINADLQVSDIAYGPSWDGVTNIAPSKNAVYDKIDSIDVLIPSAAASNNQLADKNYVDDSINQVAAYYITKNAQGDAFANYAELSAATVFYSGGVQRTPTRNDFCIVIADETHSGDATRYSYQGNQWEYQYTINNAPMTQAQVDAINSGITASKVNTYDGYASQILGKQDALTAGSNIQIDPNTNEISATDTKYTAGNGINIDANNEISVNTSVVATQTDINGVIKQGNNTVTSNISLNRSSTEKIVIGRTSDGAGITITEGSGNQQQYIEYENGWIDVKTPGSALKSYNFDNSNTGVVRFQDLSGKQDKLTASTGISIDANNNISNTLPGAIKSSTPPSNASQGDLWYDTTTDQLNSYDGSSWNPVDVDTTYTAGSGIEIDVNDEITVKLAQNSGLGINASDELEVDTSVIQTKMYSTGSTAPASPNAGDLWYDTTNDQLNSYDGTTWNSVGAGTGDVVGPSSATDGHLAVFDGATGKLIKDGGVIPVGVALQPGNIFTSGMTIWGGSSSDYSNLTPAPNTAYLII